MPASLGPQRVSPPPGASALAASPQGRAAALPARQPSARRLIGTRGLQIALGVLWLLDGALQLQPFMFTRAFSQTVLAGVAVGQPRMLGVPILWFAHLVGSHPARWNIAFAVIQIAIGIGLLIPRTVRPALIASLVWAGGVWSFGEGFGGILTGSASPLTGAPGAVLAYGLLAVVAWPWAGPGDFQRRARAVWAALWCGSALLWLLPAVRARGSVSTAIAAAVPGTPGWLHATLNHLAGDAGGHGQVIALAVAMASVLIGLGAYSSKPIPFVLAGLGLAAVMWTVGQSAGGLLSGQSTDPNIGPLFVLLGLALLPVAGSSGGGVCVPPSTWRAVPLGVRARTAPVQSLAGSRAMAPPIPRGHPIRLPDPLRMPFQRVVRKVLALCSP